MRSPAIRANHGPEAIPATPDTSPVGHLAGRVRAVCQRALAAALHVVLDDTGGIDDAALPSAFEAPYRRGSRAVRSLWHIPF